jgi:hypothetical protein
MQYKPRQKEKRYILKEENFLQMCTSFVDDLYFTFVVQLIIVNSGHNMLRVF